MSARNASRCRASSRVTESVTLMFSGQHSALPPYAVSTRHQTHFTHRWLRVHLHIRLHFPAKVFIVHLRRTVHHHASVSEFITGTLAGHVIHRLQSSRTYRPFVPSLLITTWLFCSNVPDPATGCLPCCPVYRHNRRWHSAHQPVKIPHANPAGCLLREANSPR